MALDGINKTLLTTYRLHQMGFLLGLGGMLVVDFFFLDGWSTFWVMVAWSLVFAVHFMVFQSQAVNEQWVRERLIFKVYRPWDHGHVDEIRNNPHGLSPYRTESGRVDMDGDLIKLKDGPKAGE